MNTRFLSSIVLLVLLLSDGLASAEDFEELSADEVQKQCRIYEERRNAELHKELATVDLIVLIPYMPAKGAGYYRAAIIDKDSVDGLVSALKIVAPSEGWVKDKRGEIAHLGTNCQCFGEFEASFFSRGKFVANASFHHRRHIRSMALTGGRDEIIDPIAMQKYYDAAIQLLPCLSVLPKTQTR